MLGRGRLVSAVATTIDDDNSVLILHPSTLDELLRSVEFKVLEIDPYEYYDVAAFKTLEGADS